MRRYFTAVIIMTLFFLGGCQSGSDTSSADPVSQDSKTTVVTGGKDSSDETGESVEAGVPGWYKGDLHSHSLYSDGDSSVCDVLDIAEGKGFDYFVLTDHNTADQWLDSQYYSNKMILLYGVEWTSDKGHANIWSDRPYDWDALKETLGDAGKAIALTHEMAGEYGQEILFSINHPSALTCAWEYSYEESLGADAMEVWNAKYLLPNLNFKSVNVLYKNWLDKGSRPTMVGGSDSHTHQPGFQTLYNDVGHPTTWVYARDRSAKEILRGIKEGRTFISTSPDGPFLEFLADTDYYANAPQHVEYDVMTGGTIPESSYGKDVYFITRVRGVSVPSGVLIIKNGVPFKYSMGLSADYNVSFIDKPQEGDYYRVELRQITNPNSTNPLGELLQGFIAAITNPIFTW
jgi:predicted metal-dependent phosphoesterase TrpH